MILYFSATGNSKYVAKRIAQACSEESLSIVDCMRQKNASGGDCVHGNARFRPLRGRTVTGYGARRNVRCVSVVCSGVRRLPFSMETELRPENTGSTAIRM